MTYISRDPVGPLLEPDGNGRIVLMRLGDDPKAPVVLSAGMMLVAVILWCIYFFDPSVRSLHPASIFGCAGLSVLRPLALYGAIKNMRNPFRLSIDNMGITRSGGGKSRTMLWAEMRELKLISNLEDMRSQPIGSPKTWVTTEIAILSDEFRLTLKPDLGVSPMALSDYLLKRQHENCPDAQAVLIDQTIPAEIPELPAQRDSLPWRG